MQFYEKSIDAEFQIVFFFFEKRLKQFARYFIYIVQ